MKKCDTRNTLEHFANIKIKVILQSLLVGLITGIVVVLYRILLSKLTHLREDIFLSLKYSPAINSITWLGFLILVGLGLGILIEKIPMIKGSGIPQVKGVLLKKLKMDWLKEVITKFFGGIVGPGLGLSLGREGPSVQLGSEIGLGISRIFKRHNTEEKYLITSGASAGLSAAFNAPLAGVVFSLEELHKNFTPLILLCVMGSSLVADFVSKNFLGLEPAFAFGNLDTLPLSKYFYLILLGIITGIMGAIFNYSILKSQDVYKSMDKIKDRYKAIIPFILLFILGLTMPEMLGGGHSLVEEVSHGDFTIKILLLFIIIKFIFTVICYGSGVPGGIFLPLLVIGALIGKIYGLFVVEYFGVSDSYILNFTILSMAAYFTAITKAPITGSILILEMTNSFNHLLELMVVAMVAYLVVDLLNIKSIYDSLLEKMLNGNKTEKIAGSKDKKIIMEISVSVGSSIEGKYIKDIEWPKSCLIVAIDREGSEILPKGDTEIFQGDRLIILTNEENCSEIKQILISMGEESLDKILQES